jgi:glycyl-tRNA synthetase beta chain
LWVYLRSTGFNHDIADAVFSIGIRDLVSTYNRVKALQSFLDTDDGADLLAGYKRAANILKAEAKKGDLPDGAPSQPDSPEGAALYVALQTAQPRIEAALKAEDYAAAMSALAQLRDPIDAFFTQVQIISDDIAVKDNNLRLLSLIRDTARQIADFEALQG